MKWSAIKEALPLLLTFCAVLVIGIVFFSFDRVDAALLEPTDTQPSIVDIAPIITANDNTTRNTEFRQPITTTVSPLNRYVTVIAVGLGIVLIIGIILIIIPSHHHDNRHKHL